MHTPHTTSKTSGFSYLSSSRHCRHQTQLPSHLRFSKLYVFSQAAVIITIQDPPATQLLTTHTPQTASSTPVTAHLAISSGCQHQTHVFAFSSLYPAPCLSLLQPHQFTALLPPDLPTMTGSETRLVTSVPLDHSTFSNHICHCHMHTDIVFYTPYTLYLASATKPICSPPPTCCGCVVRSRREFSR